FLKLLLLSWSVLIIALCPTCPSLYCGLTVTPAEVYVKYGDSASINCSTTIKDAAIMSWEFAVGETSGASPPHVTWMIEKLEDFTVEPFCFVTLDTNEQCKMKPNITLYKLPDSVVVSAVGNRPMKEGEEHQLQCHIYNVAPAKKLSVKWYKDDETVLTDDLQSSDVTLCNVSSIYTFTVKKSDNGSPFRCEAEFQFGPGGPLVPPSMASEPYTAVVHCRFFIALYLVFLYLPTLMSAALFLLLFCICSFSIKTLYLY
uniref:Ig-like domain-containing protein n=1 Tax=Poecilia latipinna TaxID=48699 RepID=A0A3B3VZE5_9TELE